MTTTLETLTYAIPATLLGIAFLIKAPSVFRFWRDIQLRAVGGLLLLACLVFVLLDPRNIHRMNEATGVPNIAAPICYTMVSAFCGSCLLLVIVWLVEPSKKRTFALRLVVTSYILVIAGLWTTFALADVSVERIRDLDTYYANTPFMREHIVLYLSGHFVAVVATSALIWSYVGHVQGWLRAGLVFLGCGYLMNLGFTATKSTAVVARWNGNNLDWLSTLVAPPIAVLSALLIAAGFLVPHAGPYLQEQRKERRRYRKLGPLWRTLRTTSPNSSRVRIGAWSPWPLRVVQRMSAIYDSLLKLSPYLDKGLRARAREEALASGHSAQEAVALGAVVDIISALDAMANEPLSSTDTDVGSSEQGLEDFEDLESLSLALRDSHAVEAIRHRLKAQPESVPPR
ncbi:MAB_1171c family putative transporter [Streptomyces phaeochromogenes]|uniref:MAB_1171c family putative transporter n=1 Tax=Streptomyces phaeochromogenes TaxID=1923 RepID=UPI0036905F92